MDVAETLAGLHNAAVVLHVERNSIRFQPSNLDEDLISSIRKHKQALIETLFVVFDGKPPAEIRCNDSR